VSAIVRTDTEINWKSIIANEIDEYMPLNSLLADIMVLFSIKTAGITSKAASAVLPVDSQV
jgi:hypothetical protein